MPVSPRGSNDGNNRSAEGGTGSGVSRSSRRHRRQKIRRRYQSAREEAQLAGIEPTVPEGALEPERVPGSAQGSQPLPELVARAIRRGWAVDDGMKPHLVDELVAIVMSDEMPSKAKIAAFNALRMADQHQYERDEPDKKGGEGTTVNVVNNVALGNVFDDIDRYTTAILGEADSDVHADGGAEQVDEAQPGRTEEEREAD